jgi:hypothetical protein
MNSGYSTTPLAKKLGIKKGMTIRVVHAPGNYFQLFSDFPMEVKMVRTKISKDLVHYFTEKSSELEKDISGLRKEIFPDGIIWVSWPKKSSGVKTDVTEDIIRSIALSHGLVDIKVCAIDETWSGLKLVVPVKQRIPDF